MKILKQVAEELDMAVISEIVNPADVEFAVDYVDVIQIGARNMHNFELLKAVGSVDKPVLLKRGLSATIEEFIHAAEYVVSKGNGKLMLCERGIRTYEKATRNTLDISAVPILKQETHLPVLVDVTHSTGRRDLLIPTAKAALAIGRMPLWRKFIRIRQLHFLTLPSKWISRNSMPLLMSFKLPVCTKKINSKYERQRRAMFQCSSFFLFRTFGVNDESTSAMNNSFNLFSYNLCYDFKVKLINVLYNIEERNDDKLHAFFA